MHRAVQNLLPQHAISRAVGRLARSQLPLIARPLIGAFNRLYSPDMSDAVQSDPRAYASFNAMFTRALRDGARPLAGSELTLCSPVDGTLSQFGRIEDGELIQAKGRRYTLRALLGAQREQPDYDGGHFMTIYLAPYNYHRIHMPARGRRRSMTLVPGRLFSVNAATAASVDALFARNERVVCQFDGDRVPFAMVLVGALNVGSIDTVWHGPVTPPRARRPQTWDYEEAEWLARGAEMGRFNLGSTVILLFPEGGVEFDPALRPGAAIRMGEAIGHWLER